MTDKACVLCEYWRKDKTDGVCFGGTPEPKIVKDGESYVLMWPRTKPDEYCPKFTSDIEENKPCY